ncbi:hypothetical protein ACLOJK_000443 [Asimina triloba]
MKQLVRYANSVGHGKKKSDPPIHPSINIQDAYLFVARHESDVYNFINVLDPLVFFYPTRDRDGHARGCSGTYIQSKCLSAPRHGINTRIFYTSKIPNKSSTPFHPGNIRAKAVLANPHNFKMHRTNRHPTFAETPPAKKVTGVVETISHA